MTLVAISELEPGLVERNWYPVAKGRIEAITAGGHRLISYADGTEELYDIVDDPEELDDLSSTPGAAPVLSALRNALDAVIGRGHR